MATYNQKNFAFQNCCTVVCFSMINFSFRFLNSFCLKHFSLGFAMKNRYYQGFPICWFHKRSIAIVCAPGQWAYYILSWHKSLIKVIHTRKNCCEGRNLFRNSIRYMFIYFSYTLIIMAPSEYKIRKSYEKKYSSV